MPIAMLTIDGIMERDRRDMFIMEFRSGGDELWPYFDRRNPHPSYRRHMEWFAARGLRVETTAPRGWLEGDAGLRAVHFNGPDDPRIAEYTADFERPDGKSLDPGHYQMNHLPYASWLEAREERRRRGEPDDDTSDP